MPFKKGQSGNPGGKPKTKPVLLDYYTPKELKEFIDDLKRTAKTDPVIKKFVAEQLFGKAAQNINLGGQEDNPVVVDLPDDVKQQLDQFLISIKK